MSEVEFKRETWSVLKDEAADLFEEHYREVAHYLDIPLNPDHENYFGIENRGLLRVYTARERGILIGYSVYFLKRNMHYMDSLQAVQDIIFIQKNKRGGGLGSKLILWCDEQLKDDGIQVVYHHVKVKEGLNFGPMLERHGYELIDQVYGRRLN